MSQSSIGDITDSQYFLVMEPRVDNDDSSSSSDDELNTHREGQSLIQLVAFYLF